MSSRKLCSRSCSVDGGAGSVQGNLNENNFTDFSQEAGIMTTEIQDSEVIASNPNLSNTSDDNAIINLNSDDQPNNVSQDQLKEFINTVMQAIKVESAKQTALHEESKKQTALLHKESKRETALQEEAKKQTAALLQAESAKLTSAVESLRSEIKKENENLAKSLTAKFGAAHNKIREDFEVRLNSEIQTVSASIDDVRKDNENETNKLLSTTDEVYARVSEKIGTDVTQTREAIR